MAQTSQLVSVRGCSVADVVLWLNGFQHTWTAWLLMAWNLSRSARGPGGGGVAARTALPASSRGWREFHPCLSRRRPLLLRLQPSTPPMGREPILGNTCGLLGARPLGRFRVPAGFQLEGPMLGPEVVDSADLDPVTGASDESLSGLSSVGSHRCWAQHQVDRVRSGSVRTNPLPVA